MRNRLPDMNQKGGSDLKEIEKQLVIKNIISKYQENPGI